MSLVGMLGFKCLCKVAVIACQVMAAVKPRTVLPVSLPEAISLALYTVLAELDGEIHKS